MSDNMDIPEHDYEHDNELDNEDLWTETMETYSDPFIWVRANGNTIHIKDMNTHHLGNAIRHLEKTMEGSEKMPAIYFNMLKLSVERGMGITADQINRLLAMATKVPPPKRMEWAAWDERMDYEKYDGTILAIREMDDKVELNLVDSQGDVEHTILTFDDRKLIIHTVPDGVELVLPKT